MRGVDIIENCEVTGIDIKDGRVTAIDTTRGTIRAKKVGLAVAGNTSRVGALAGLRLPIESHVLQAFVSEGIKPAIDHVVTFGAGHFYISQSDKGGLVFGGDLDGYNSYAWRGNLPTVEDVMEEGMAIWPGLGRIRMLRQWGGLMDMSMDGSPIIDRTPVERPLSQLRLVLWRLQGDAGVRLVLRASDCARRAVSGRGRAAARSLRHRRADRRARRRRAAEPALRRRCVSLVPSAVRAATRSSPTSATRTCARPDPATPDAPRAFHRLRLSARQSVRPASRALVSRRRLPQVARGHAQHAHARDQRCDVRGRRRRAVSSHRLASGGLIDRDTPLSLHVRRRDVLGLCRRHARLGADRERRAARRPLVQVSSAARHPDRGLGRAERAGRVAHRRAARAEHARHDRRALRWA